MWLKKRTKNNHFAHDCGFPHEYVGVDVRVTRLPDSDDVMCKLCVCESNSEERKPVCVGSTTLVVHINSASWADMHNNGVSFSPAKAAWLVKMTADAHHQTGRKHMGLLSEGLHPPPPSCWASGKTLHSIACRSDVEIFTLSTQTGDICTADPSLIIQVNTFFASKTEYFLSHPCPHNSVRLRLRLANLQGPSLPLVSLVWFWAKAPRWELGSPRAAKQEWH